MNDITVISTQARDCLNLWHVYLTKREIESRHVKNRSFANVDIKELDLIKPPQPTEAVAGSSNESRPHDTETSTTTMDSFSSTVSNLSNSDLNVSSLGSASTSQSAQT